MDDEKQTQTTGATAEQAGAFVAELIRAMGEEFERQNKFEAAYANNFNFEPSVWDLRILFGQLEQHTGTSVVDWHTAITIPWLQVKLVAYFLRLQALWNELQNGPINIPTSVMPKLDPPTEEQSKNPMNVAWYEACKKIHQDMFGAS